MNYFRIFSLGIIASLATLFLVNYSNSIEFPSYSGLAQSYIKKEKPLNILVFGDIMLDRDIRKVISDQGLNYLFENIQDTISSSNIVAANLEGVVSDNQSISTKNLDILRFTFDKKNAKALKEIGFDALSQANNHTNDFGISGEEESRKNLLDVGISPFGDYFNENPGPVIVEKNNKKIAFIGFNEFSYKNFDKFEQVIKDAKAQADYVIVMPHFGIEYSKTPSSFQQKVAREFIDSGADAVIGSHPHVIEPIEIYNGKPIFYSLGNFIFDQYFSVDTKEGLGVKISISKDKVFSFELLPFNIIYAQATPKNEEEKNKTLNWLAENSSVSPEIKEQIKKGKFVILE